ncbi:MAG: cell division protein FtsL [Nitrospiraceae bacterium]
MKASAIVVVMALVLLFVWERVDIVRLGYHIERLKAQKVLLDRERDELQVRLSALTSPERIARTATEKLGMVSPQQGQVVLVHPDREGPSNKNETEVRLAKNDTARRIR